MSDIGRSVRPARLRGGVHPPQRKALSASAGIVPAGLPPVSVLPLQQHLGPPSVPVVAIGDRVLEDQVIARAEGPLGVALHAPAAGRVLAIEARPVAHPSGLAAPCIVIGNDGSGARVDPDPVADPYAVDPAALIARIRDAGIAGMGGAGFSTAVKQTVAEGSIRTLIVNGTECEPYITADDRLMREQAERILDGVAITAHIVRPERILIAIEDNKPEAIAAMRAAVTGHAGAGRAGLDLQVVVLPTIYPSGGEKQLIAMLTGHEVPSGGLPVSVGVLCQNVGTFAAIADAVLRGRPLTTRITTLTGEAFARPGNREVRIGTPVHHLLAEGGADTAGIHRLVMGGPMMGFTLEDPSVPVVKTTNCLIAATVSELPDPPPQQPCIRCGLCVTACPAGLQPQQLYWHARARDLDGVAAYHVQDCIECGACAFVCPSSIPLVQYYRFAKGELRDRDEQARQSDHARERFEARKARLERIAAEREAARAARMEAARRKAAAKANADAPPPDLAEPAAGGGFDAASDT